VKREAKDEVGALEMLQYKTKGAETTVDLKADVGSDRHPGILGHRHHHRFQCFDVCRLI
jgi:hypothetical protein